MTAPAAAARRAAGLVVPALLVLVAFLQSPGRVTFDTDLGLALNPTHLLHRALHLWSAENGFGGVGDQTYGFLFPIGPFFALGDLLGLPPWVTQRLWCGLVLVVAYEGARRLARRMVSPSVAATVVAGLGWALSSRMLTVVGPFSSEGLTVALAPWLLLPLVCYLERDRRRAVWLSGIAVLMLGAANAGATVAVLPLPLLYLLTRPVAWRRRVTSTAWWGVAVGLASLWWVGPLLLLGANSPPFTDWVESARTTTDPVTGLAALRGTTDWVAYVPQGNGGFWPAAWDLATARGLLVATGAVAVLGLAGLASRRLPERRFLLLCAVLGFAALTLGHEGHPGSVVAAGFRSLLDGPAVPFRNVYKLDPLLRLPMLLGLAHLIDRRPSPTPVDRLAPAPGRGLMISRSFQLAASAVAAAAVLLAAMPALRGDLRPGPSFTALPSWWHSAASYLAEHDGTGRTLVLPEATAGQYTWGRTIGEPLEALATTPWAVRNQVPLTQPGNTRVVDAVESVLQSGRGSTALAEVLARLGVRQLLVRNDLDRRVADTLRPARVRAALTRSPGMTRVASFGPPVAASSVTDGGTDVAVPSLEVWKVDPTVTQVQATPLTDVVAVAGGPEDLLSLVERELVSGGQPTVLASAPGLGDWVGPRVLTDGLQKRERSFGRVHDALGPLLTADDAYRQPRPVHDLLPPGDTADQQTVVSFEGIRSVTASSSAAYPESFGATRSGTDPGAVLDGNLTTFWSSASLRHPVGEWLQVVRRAATTQDTVSLAMVKRVLFGSTVTSVRLTTDAGSVVRTLKATEEPQQLALPPGSWSRLRVTIESVAGNPRFGLVGIRELSLPGNATTRSVVLRGQLPAGAQPPAVLLRAADPIAPCVVVDGVTRCDALSADGGDETVGLDRTVTLPSDEDLSLSGTVLPQLGNSVERLLNPLAPHLTAIASGSLDAGPVGAHAAVDGDPTTSWIALPGDATPTLTLLWPKTATVSSVELVAADQPRASFPTRIHVRSPAGDRDAVVGADGVARFAPLRTTQLALTFPALRLVATASSANGGRTALPVGIAEVRVPGSGVPSLGPDRSAQTGAVCGFGPDVVVDGTVHHTRVIGTVGDLLDSSPLTVTSCDGSNLFLKAGAHRIRVVGTVEFRVRSLVLTPRDLPLPGPHRSVTVRSWGNQHRTVTVAAGDAALLSVPEAAGAGWHATLGGHALTPMMVDGWAQGWVVPAGAGGLVHLDFAPDSPYRLSLLIGLLAVLLLVALAVRAVRDPQHDALVVPNAVDPRLPTAVLVVAGALVVGGWAGLIGAAASVIAVRLGKRGCAAVAVWALPLVDVLLIERDKATPVFSAQAGATSQWLCLLAVGALAGLLTARREPPVGPADVAGP